MTVILANNGHFRQKSGYFGDHSTIPGNPRAGIIWIWSLGFDPSDLFQIWNICLYPSWRVNYTVNILSGHPIIRYRVFQFRWSWGWSVVKVCNGFCFFLFNIFLIFLKRIWLTCSIFFFQRISDPVQSQFQMVYHKLNSREIFLRWK